ncbi:MAG: lysylphosphatidylglycerol synthase transmembrane domain-containing protein [Eubacteriales bacterium]
MSNKSKFYRIIGYIFIILLFYHLIKTTDFHIVFMHIRYIKLKTVGFLILLQLITQLLLTLQWYLISKSIVQQSSFLKILHIFTRGTIIEAITPGAKIGGEVTRLYLLKKDLKCNTDQALSIIIIQKSISMSVLFTICIASFLHISRNIVDYFSFVIQFVIIVICILLIVLMIMFLLFADYLLQLLSKSSNKFFTKLHHFMISYVESTQKLTKFHWCFQFIISTFVWLLFPFKMVVLAKALEIRLPFMIIIAITMTAYMMSMLPITPGGIGTFEGTMYTLFSIFSIESSFGITATILFRFITFWFVIIYSALVTGVYETTTYIIQYFRKRNI